MKHFLVFDSIGKIFRSGTCQDSTFERQAKGGEFVIEGIANDVTQKVIDGKIVDKMPEEIEAEKPPKAIEIPIGQRLAQIRNEEWQKVLDRVGALENKR